MSELYEQLLFWINAIWRRRWAALAVTWFVCAAGWVFVASKPDTYTSTTRIFIDTASILKPLLRGLTVERDINEELQVMQQTITSRPNLERVARMTDLDLSASTPLAMEVLIDRLRRQTIIQSAGYVLAIGFTDTDPVRARDVVDAIKTVFIEQNLGDNREEIESARLFLDRQIAEYEIKLQDAEQRLADFKQDKLSTLPDRFTSSFQLEELRAELEDAQVALKRAQVRRDFLRNQVARGPAADISLELFKAKEEVSDLLTRFREQHPQVLALQRRIDDLNEKRRTELLRAGIDPDTPEADASIPANGLVGADYEQLRVMLAEAEAGAEILVDKVNRVSGQVRRLEGQTAQIPIVEAELSRLNRDYDVLRSKHEELLGRREQAIISQKKEVGADRIQFQVVEPARVPAAPNGPSRPVLMAVVLIFGLSAGACFAIFLSIINETYSDPAQLRQAFGVPVLGIVTPVRSAARQGFAIATHSSFLLTLSLLLMVFVVMTMNIGHLRALELGSFANLDDLWLRVSGLLGF